MFKPRIFYTLGLWLLLPYIFFHLLWRAHKQPEYLKHIAERFGFYTTRPSKPIIWLHTVSVGETRAAATLVQRLRETYPGHQILLTHTTPTGRAASALLYADDVLRAYLPYDYPFAIRRFLKHYQPCLGVLLETEIWFNLIHICHTQSIPLLLLNARLSARSAAGYARFPRLVRSGLQELRAIAAQSNEDAERLQALGAAGVTVMGNLKFDIHPPASLLELGKHWRSLFGAERKVLLAASTRAGEEELLLDALFGLSFPRRRESISSDNPLDSRRSLPSNGLVGGGNDKSKDGNGHIKTIFAVPNFLLVIVPRHPQRFDEVAALLTQHGIRFQRKSAGLDLNPDTQVVLGDSMGEMFAYYAACDIAFIGGSLLPFGGQNLIEACVVGKPVLIGEHTYNFAQATQQALDHGAALRVHDADELAHTLQTLFQDPARMSEMGAAGMSFVSANRGATERALSLIGQFMTK